MWKDKIKSAAPVLVPVAAFATGAGGSYLVTKRLLETKYAELSRQEIEQAKAYYENQSKKSEYSPQALIEELHNKENTEEELKQYSKLIQHYQNTGETAISIEDIPDYDDLEALERYEEKEKEAIRTSNIFAQKEENDMAIEERDSSRPYIVSQEENFENVDEYDQITLTYFAGDDTLVDDRDDVVRDSDRIVGDVNLTKFGVGANSSNVLYIRNENLDTDFEVLRDDGKYTEKVLGYIEHSDDRRRKTPRFRGDDE